MGVVQEWIHSTSTLKGTSKRINSFGREDINSGSSKESTIQYIHMPWLEIDVVKSENKRENTLTGLVEAARAFTLIGYA